MPASKMLPQPKRRPTCLALGWPLDTTHKYGLNADDVLRSPHVRASHLRVAAREEINKTLAIIEQTRWRTQPHSPRARPSEKAPDRQIGRPTPNASKAGKQEAKGASRLALGRGDGKGRRATPPKRKPFSAKSVRAMVVSRGKRRSRKRQKSQAKIGLGG